MLLQASWGPNLLLELEGTNGKAPLSWSRCDAISAEENSGETGIRVVGYVEEMPQPVA